MINLQVKDYCQDCPYFEPRADKLSAIDLFDKPLQTETYITCENKETCERIVEYLQTKAKGSLYLDMNESLK